MAVENAFSFVIDAIYLKGIIDKKTEAQVDFPEYLGPATTSLRHLCGNFPTVKH